MSDRIQDPTGQIRDALLERPEPTLDLDQGDYHQTLCEALGLEPMPRSSIYRALRILEDEGVIKRWPLMRIEVQGDD